MFNLMKQDPRFPELEQKIITRIANADSISESFNLYAEYRSLIPDWKFVFAAERGAVAGHSVNRTFSNGSAVRTLFFTKNVLVLNAETWEEMNEQGKTVFAIDYSIALDTQALSYLEPYLIDRTSKLPSDFKEIFAFISQDEVYVDPIPYMTENLPNIDDEGNLKQIREKLRHYEILRTIDADYLNLHGQVKSMSSDGEIAIAVEKNINQMLIDASSSGELSKLLYRHTFMYCLLLKMTAIQIRNPQASLEKKFEELMKFMDNQLQTIFSREAVVAIEYFKRGQTLKFFGKIHKGAPNLLAKLKNMAWDFWHIRYIEEAATITPTHKARYFFPSILTCDKGFIEIIELFPLKSYAFQQGTGKPIPFALIDIVKKLDLGKDAGTEFIEKYFSSKRIQRRNDTRDNVKLSISALVIELESDLCAVAILKK